VAAVPGLKRAVAFAVPVATLPPLNTFSGLTCTLLMPKPVAPGLKLGTKVAGSAAGKTPTCRPRPTAAAPRSTLPTRGRFTVDDAAGAGAGRLTVPVRGAVLTGASKGLALRMTGVVPRKAAAPVVAPGVEARAPTGARCATNWLLARAADGLADGADGADVRAVTGFLLVLALKDARLTTGLDAATMRELAVLLVLKMMDMMTSFSQLAAMAAIADGR
jgi:hypothetical protein